MNQISALNNPYGVDIAIKQIKQTKEIRRNLKDNIQSVAQFGNFYRFPYWLRNEVKICWIELVKYFFLPCVYLLYFIATLHRQNFPSIKNTTFYIP